jgi:hypothetical protein
MPYSYIQKNQSIEEAGIKYLNRDYKLELSPTSIITIPEKGRQVQLPVSLFIFLQNNCRNTSNQYFVNFFDYSLTKQVTNPKYCIDSQFFPMTDYFKIVNPDKIQFQNLV